MKKIIYKLYKKYVKPSVTPPQTFSYRKPDAHPDSKRDIVGLCGLRNMRGAVHVVRRGGEEHLHSHQTVDGLWMVLNGKVRFWADGDEMLGEFGPMEGILVPRRNRYRFEIVGDQDAELLQVLSIDSSRGFERQDYEEQRFDRESQIRRISGRTDRTSR